MIFTIFFIRISTRSVYCLICRSRQTNSSRIFYIFFFSILNNCKLHSSRFILCSLVSPAYSYRLSMRYALSAYAIYAVYDAHFSIQTAIWWRYRMQTIKTFQTVFCELSTIQGENKAVIGSQNATVFYFTEWWSSTDCFNKKNYVHNRFIYCRTKTDWLANTQKLFW